MKNTETNEGSIKQVYHVNNIDENSLITEEKNHFQSAFGNKLFLQNTINQANSVDFSRLKSREENARKTVCPTCGKLVHASSYETHLNSHPQYSCALCDEAFKTEEELRKHQELHEVNPYPCSDCNLSFNRPIDFALHSRKHYPLGGFKCPCCSYETPHKAAIKLHIRRHEKDFDFVCETCGKGFLCNATYQEHVEAHNGIKKFTCHICNKKFLFKRYLHVHLKLNHKNTDEVYECHVCKRNFTFKKSLVRHLSLIHNVGKSTNVTCNVCNKVVANPYNLKMHLRIHTGERPFVCENCGKAFSKQVYLKRHLLKHDMKTK